MEAQELKAEPVIIAPDLQLDTNSVREWNTILWVTPKISAKGKDQIDVNKHLFLPQLFLQINPLKKNYWAKWISEKQL